jgi:hypothetical protein
MKKAAGTKKGCNTKEGKLASAQQLIHTLYEERNKIEEALRASTFFTAELTQLSQRLAKKDIEIMKVRTKVESIK